MIAEINSTLNGSASLFDILFCYWALYYYVDVDVLCLHITSVKSRFVSIVPIFAFIFVDLAPSWSTLYFNVATNGNALKTTFTTCNRGMQSRKPSLFLAVELCVK